MVLTLFASNKIVAQSDSDKNQVKNRVKQFEMALNSFSTSATSLDDMLSNYFFAPSIEIEDDLTTHPPSSSNQSPQSTFPKRYLQRYRDFKCSIKYNIISVSDFCKNEQGSLRTIVQVSRTVTFSKSSGATNTITRFFEMVSVNNVWKINAMTYSKNSRLISKCTNSPTADPTYAEIEAIKSNLNKTKKERDKAKTQAANLKKEKAKLDSALADERAKSEDCASENSNLNKRVYDLNGTITSLSQRVQKFEEEQLARQQAEREEQERIAEARLDLSYARALYNSLLAEEAELQGKPQERGAWNAFYEKEKDVIYQIWKTLEKHLPYLESKDNLMLVDILGSNRGNIIELLSPTAKDATNLANRMILQALGDVAKDGDYQDLAKVDKVIENIDEYIKIQKQMKDIEMDLRRAVDAYSQRKNYNTALRTFIQYDKYLTRMPADLQYKVKYQQGTILLWNLGNIANATNLSKGKMNEYIKNRKYRGMELLNDVQKNASDENLKRKAQIAMAKYKY